MIVKKCTSTYVELEGGFWGLIDQEGNQYKPIHFYEQLKTPNIQFKISMKQVDIMSFHMWGMDVKIISFTTS